MSLRMLGTMAGDAYHDARDREKVALRAALERLSFAVGRLAYESHKTLGTATYAEWKAVNEALVEADTALGRKEK